MDAIDSMLASSVLETATLFDTTPRKQGRRTNKTYLEFWDLYESDFTFTEIARKLGETRQATEQRYDRWFAKHQGPSEQRKRRIFKAQRVRVNENRMASALEQHHQDPLFAFLLQEAMRVGKALEPIVDFTNVHCHKGPNPVYRVRGRCLRRYHRETAFFPGNGHAYATFHITRSMIFGIYACIFFVDIPEYERELYIVPVSLLRRAFQESDREIATFYVPIGPTRVKPAQGSIDFRKLKNAWWMLDVRSV
jgi:hypothetical protein